MNRDARNKIDAVKIIIKSKKKQGLDASWEEKLLAEYQKRPENSSDSTQVNNGGQ